MDKHKLQVDFMNKTKLQVVNIFLAYLENGNLARGIQSRCQTVYTNEINIGSTEIVKNSTSKMRMGNECRYCNVI